MKSIPISISEKQGFRRYVEPITMGIPFPHGVLKDTSCLSLLQSEQVLASQIEAKAYWADGSIKWVLLDFQINMEANSEVSLELVKDHQQSLYSGAKKDPSSERINARRGIEICETDTEVIVDCGHIQFYIDKVELRPFKKICSLGQDIYAKTQTVLLEDKNALSYQPIINAVEIRHRHANLRSSVSLCGHFINEAENNSSEPIAFIAELTFYANRSDIEWQFTIHNPRPAKHNKGLWDLGDKGSFLFQRLVSRFELDAEYQINWKKDVTTPWNKWESKRFLLLQSASGGENWQSRNHLNSAEVIPLHENGYRCFDGEKIFSQGERASPFVQVYNQHFSITAHLQQFWQNFPKAIEIAPSGIEIAWFPAQHMDGFELQGGERKTHTLQLDFGPDKHSLDYSARPLETTIPGETYQDTNLFPGLVNQCDDPLDELISLALDEKQGFVAKREWIDEYGWRNFGELFADHESLYRKQSGLNISHYNNQYDPLYSFAKQYMRTGDIRWFELFSDLARHIVDIDIYHTDKDRHEYNDGLFWHTDHYVDADTCTHRTFSKQHINDENPISGGGPGSEHCYTTGLTLHYFMTGAEQSKQAVLKLVDWMVRLNEGNDGLLERLLTFKQKELPILKRLLRGEKIPQYFYPFTRGTGNYINALLDAYSISGDSQYLARVEKIIPLTIHPKDDICHRDLENIEKSWSYSILLQSLINYLYLKTADKAFDSAFYYARESLIHYCDWMLENEYPFLEKPERLEFPNDTWTAQDMRKAQILLAASLFNPEKKYQYLEKSHYFINYVIDRLRASETRSYTRIVVILLQNQFEIPHQFEPLVAEHEPISGQDKVPMYSATGMVLRFLRDITKRLFKFSIKREKQWLQLRLTR